MKKIASVLALLGMAAMVGIFLVIAINAVLASLGLEVSQALAKYSFSVNTPLGVGILISILLVAAGTTVCALYSNQNPQSV